MALPPLHLRSDQRARSDLSGNKPFDNRSGVDARF